ncbi:MAG: hypothetical protein QG649_79 [Patescibacteria group bacterium]|jgi:hypothetical protein|nr:hypothetical protein [Candidatus Saccharibacteria bacterium]MDQ5886522.1 hypothetical protein [Patescibacteria group bacterium]MDQ5931994.1 hypothetical protein [Patescibacteria group bacterium]
MNTQKGSAHILIIIVILLIIAGTLAFALWRTIGWSPESDSPKNTEQATSRQEGYINSKTNVVSFEYPSDWKIVDKDNIYLNRFESPAWYNDGDGNPKIHSYGVGEYFTVCNVPTSGYYPDGNFFYTYDQEFLRSKDAVANGKAISLEELEVDGKRAFTYIDLFFIKNADQGDHRKLIIDTGNRPCIIDYMSVESGLSSLNSEAYKHLIASLKFL